MLIVSDSAMDRDYLSRPLLDVEFRINDKEVYVCSDHTGYANVVKLERLVKEDVLKLYSEVIKLSKARGVKISYKNHFKRTINENWGKYREELKYYDELFEQIKEKFLEIEKRGLHKGTTDDMVLKEAFKLTSEYQKVYWRNSANSSIQGIYRLLQRHYDALNYPDCDYYMIYL